jgi:hypothetical protein
MLVRQHRADPFVVERRVHSRRQNIPPDRGQLYAGGDAAEITLEKLAAPVGADCILGAVIALPRPLETMRLGELRRRLGKVVTGLSVGVERLEARNERAQVRQLCGRAVNPKGVVRVAVGAEEPQTLCADRASN